MKDPIPLPECKRILVTRLSSIGDVVMATPVAKALRKACPDAYIAWLVEPKSKDAVIDNPYLDEVIVWNRTSYPAGGHLARLRYALGETIRITRVLRDRRFDVAIDLQGLIRSAGAGVLSGARYRLGRSTAREGSVLLYNRVFPAERFTAPGPQECLDMLQLMGVHTNDLDMHMPVSEADIEYADRWVDLVTSGNGRDIAVLCPATTWPNKYWTEEGWANLADRLSADHGLLPVFLGGGNDVDMIGRIIARTRHGGENVAGKTSLKQSAALVRASRLVVAVDTGMLHIAVALGKPSIGVFGPSAWRDFAKKDNLVSVAKEFPCSPCLRHPTCTDYDCMRAISPDDILSAAEPWLNHRTGARELLDADRKP